MIEVYDDLYCEGKRREEAYKNLQSNLMARSSLSTRTHMLTNGPTLF